MTLKGYCIYCLITISSASFCQSPMVNNTNIQKAEGYKKTMNRDSAIYFYKIAAIDFQKAGDVENLIETYNQIGTILTRQDKYEEAKNYLFQAMNLALSKLDSNDLALANTYINLGVIYNAEQLFEESLKYHFKALGIRLIVLGENHADVATSYGNIGNVYRNKKDLDKAIEAHTKAMLIREKLFGSQSAEIIESFVGLGNSYLDKNELSTSLIYFDKALNNKVRQRGEGHKDLVKYYNYVSKVHYLLNDIPKGDEFKLKAEAIEKK